GVIPSTAIEEVVAFVSNEGVVAIIAIELIIDGHKDFFLQSAGNSIIAGVSMVKAAGDLVEPGNAAGSAAVDGVVAIAAIDCGGGIDATEVDRVIALARPEAGRSARFIL